MVKKYCLDCGKEIGQYSKRCRSCATKLQYKKDPSFNKDKNNHFYGKSFTKEKSSRWKGCMAVKRQKYHCIMCYRRICYQAWKNTKKCRSCNKIDKNNPMYGMSGKLSPTFGSIYNPPAKVKYKNIWMRSSWEKLYAEYLDKQKIEWLYESKTFDLENSTYTPDFYLIQENKYIEIKGYFTDYAKNKIKVFQNLYPHINFNILMKEDLVKLEII